jgi:hypothetical protein
MLLPQLSFLHTLQEQGLLNHELYRELVAQEDRGSERASNQTTAAVGIMSRDFKEHQKEIMVIQLQIARVIHDTKQTTPLPISYCHWAGTQNL